MDHDLLDRLRRLRQAHIVLAAELSATQRALYDARVEVAGLRAQAARKRQKAARSKSVRTLAR
jgi:hypothetical protein